MKVLGPYVGDILVINSQYQGRKHRYSYFLVSSGETTVFGLIAYVDTEPRELLKWQSLKAYTPGEAIFVDLPLKAR